MSATAEAAMVWMVIGCTGAEPAGPQGPGDTPPDTAPTPTTPSAPTTPPWTDPGATEPPPFHADALGNALGEALLTVLTLDATPALDGYDAVMGFETAGCPAAYGYPAYDGFVETWYAQCQTGGGAVFSGYAYDYQDAAYTSDQGYRGLYAEATVVSPDGESWSGVGYWARGDYGSNGSVDLYVELDGVLVYDGASAETWVGAELAPSLSLHRAQPRDRSWQVVEVDGSFTGLEGALDTVAFADVALDGTLGCAEPTGTISIRTPDAVWFDLVFAGDPDEPDGCDGCAEATWRGAAMGTVCADFGPWMTGVTP